MKGVRNLLIGVILGAIMGWFLGFLRLPDVAIKPSFFMGFFICAVLFLLVFVLAKSWKKETDEQVTIEKMQKMKNGIQVSRRARLPEDCSDFCDWRNVAHHFFNVAATKLF
jgi:hypothetical protein